MIKTKIDVAGIIASIVLAVVCVLVAVFGGKMLHRSTPAPAELVYTQPEKEIVVKEVEKYVEVEKKISSDLVEEKLRGMGFLVTGEYCFTGVMNHSSASRFFKSGIVVPFSESSYIASYDGVVSAGVDFAAVSVTKDESRGILTVCVPRASIYAIDIDPESFVLYSEKQSVFNPISVADYNDSLIELEANASAMAEEKGLLEKAEKNADAMIRNFVSGIWNDGEYSVSVVFE